MIEAYNRIGYQAYNVSNIDFAAGLDFIKELAAKAQFPFLSANIMDSATRELHFSPYVVVTLGVKKFGIVGVTAPGKIPAAGVYIADPLPILQELLPKIRRQADYVILLSSLDKADQNLLLDAELPLDIVLIASGYSYNHSLETRGQKVAARCGNIGKYVGELQINITTSDVPLQDVSNFKASLKYARRRLKSYQERAGGQSLEEYYKDKPATLNLIQNLREQSTDRQQQIATVKNPVDYDLIALDASIADDPEIRKLLDGLK